MSSPPDTLNLLLEAIQEQGAYVLAAPEDADFFRKRKAPAPPPPKVEAPPPAIIKPLPPAPKKEAPPSPPPAPKIAIAKEEIAKPTLNLSVVQNVLSIVAPELAILPEIPSDAIARKIAERCKTKNQTAPLSLLLLHEPPEQRALLEQIAKALDIYFGPAKVVQAEAIEKEKQWEAFLSVPELKMVIACDYTLWQLNGLMQFYKETPAQGTRTLGKVPLFLLPDLSLYLKDPLLKRSLWKALCQKCS